MTNKQRMMAQAMAAGKPLQEAAQLAGYNLPYARKKAREPAFLALVERLREKAERYEAESRDVVENCWSIINDPTASNQERVAAMRTLITYDRAHPDNGGGGDVVIIDDVPPMCENCPNTGKEFTGGETIVPDGRDPDAAGRGDHRRGFEKDLPRTAAIPEDGR